MSKFLSRVWTCVNQVAQKSRRRGEAALKRTLPDREGRDPLARDIACAQECRAWVVGLVHMLISNIYPGAPFERRCTALDLLNCVADSWKSADDVVEGFSEDLQNARCLLKSPYSVCMTSKPYTDVLLGALVDSWEKLRLTAFDLLCRHPSPLAGMETPAQLEARLCWAMELLRSPRVRESDAGALLIRLLIRKYVYGLKWEIHLSPIVRVSMPSDTSNIRDTGVRVLGSHICDICRVAIARTNQRFKRHTESLCDLLAHDLALADEDMIKACRQSLGHGAVLLMRYALQDIDLVRANRDDLKAPLNRMLALLARATDLALGFISQPDALGATAEDVNHIQGDEVIDDIDDDDVSFDLAPKSQIITTACWLTVKEISLLTGEVTRASVFNVDTLKSAGEKLFNVLFTVKHTGALEKTRIGATTLCARLMCSSDRALSELPQLWLSELMDQLRRPDQGVRDRVRRSAGLPYAFMAILLAEPKGQARVALNDALPRLLDIALDDSGSNIPQVHAFNVIRVIFADRDLSAETTAHAARGVEACIRAFSSPSWEVQNAATLAFASLLTKVCGYMNTAPRNYVFTGAARREVSGVEFFLRFPSLHSFLLQEVIGARFSAYGAILHPSLYPILALLSRLKPSVVDSESMRQNLSPRSFFAYVLSCASGKYFAVRTAAARALCPVVPTTEVARYASHILEELLEKSRIMKHSNAAHGMLLCVHELLNEVLFTSSTEIVRREIVHEVAVGLTACANYVMNTRVPLISAAWLRCAEALVAIANSLGSPLTDKGRFAELVHIAWQCSSPVLCADANNHPGAADWNRAAAGIRVRFSLAHDARRAPFTTFTKECIDVGDVTTALLDALNLAAPYEYRAEAYKSLRQISDTSQGEDRVALRQFAIRMLAGEQRHTVVCHALQCVSSWSTSLSQQADEAHVWEVVRGATMSNINERVRAEGLRCLGTLCARQLQSNAAEAIASGRLRGFVRMMLDGCEPAVSEETRAAAVDALSSSELLSRLSSATVCDDAAAELALDVWRCALMLLEDEDVGIRDVASKASALAVANATPGAQSEVILRVAFRHMHANFGHFSCVKTFIIDIAKGPSYTKAQFETILARSTKIRRLFDKEPDNTHAEPMHLAQLAAAQVHLSCGASSAESAFDEVSQTLTNMKDALEAFASRDSQWVGGITAHEDCFLPMCNALLGAWAFSAHISCDDDVRNSRLQTIFKSLRSLVTPSLREMMRETVSLKSFPPYFVMPF